MPITKLFKHDKFKEVCETIESHHSFKEQMTAEEALKFAKKIQAHTTFITPSDLKYQESDGRHGKVYRILKIEWDYDCFPYNASNMIPYQNNNDVLLVHADGTCTSHTKDYETQQVDFTSGNTRPASFNLDDFLKSIPQVKQPQLEVEQTSQMSKTV